VRPSFRPRPTREGLLASPLHAIARDFPETLEEFRAHGVSLEASGGEILAAVSDAEGLLDDLEAATAWRPTPVASGST
jgi:hypothetical protein